MLLACLFVDNSPLATDLKCFTAVTLDGRHELDAAVAVLVVVVTWPQKSVQGE
jgi:hypothetical protein